LTIDVDATLITAHSEKEQAAGNYKGGYGFHPLMAYADQTREALGGMLRPGNAGSNTAADHVTVLDLALEQIPARYIESIEILVRADTAGATHGLLDYCREANLRFSVGYELTENVRAAILTIPADAWVPALERDGSVRKNGEIVEITDHVDLSSWPERSRVIVRRERPHPGAQLSFTDHDGYRFQAILTDQTDENIAVIECRHRQHAHVEDRIRDDKDTGLAKFPFKEFKLNEVWLEIVMLAHDLIVWTQALLLTAILPTPNRNGCATGCSTSPPDSRSTAAAHDYAYNTTGPGPATSWPRSASSKRSQPPPADPAAGPPPRPSRPPASPPRSPLPANRPTSPPSSSRNRLAPNRPPNNITTKTPDHHQAVRNHTHTPTARFGLGELIRSTGTSETGPTTTKAGRS